MAAGPRAEIQDKLSDITECSICSEIFTNPKILPCVHTFCLRCLEDYGKDKKPGDRRACPLCRNEFAIPDGGLCNLPNNFLIAKMIEIGKLAMTPSAKALCALCPEEEEAFAKLFCMDCQHSLCDRCSKSHKKTKLCQNHQIVEFGSQLSPQKLRVSNCYCDRHPGEQIKMYCYDDNVAICLICFAESHQSHTCENVNKASEKFTAQLKDDLRKVTDRFPECEEVLKRLTEYKQEFTEEVLKTEQSIHETATKLRELVDQHEETLIQNLTSVRNRNAKATETTKQDVERFRVMIGSYNGFSEELLTKGSDIDICRAAFQLHTRANELDKLPANCSGDDFHCDTISLRPTNVEDLLKKHGSNNAIGLLLATASPDPLIVFQREISVSFPCETEPLHFIMKHRELKKEIQEVLKQNSSSVIWPETDINEVKLLIVNEFHQKSLNDRKRKIQDIIQNYLSDIDCKKVTVHPEIWNEFKSEIQDNFARSIESKSLLDIAFDNEEFEMQCTGLRKDIVEFEKTLAIIKESLEKELQQRKKITSETVENHNPHQLALIKTEQFQKKLKQGFPNVIVEVKTNQVILCGMSEDVKKVKLFLCENVSSALQSSFKISDLMSRMFLKNEVSSYLTQQLLGRNISASWMNNDGTIVVFALDDRHLKEATEVLKNEVVEKGFVVQLISHFEGNPPPEKDFIRRLCEKDKLLEVEFKFPGIVVACLSRSVRETTETVKNVAKNSGIFLH